MLMAVAAHVCSSPLALPLPLNLYHQHSAAPRHTLSAIARTAREADPREVPQRPAAGARALPRKLGGVERPGAEVAGAVGDKLDKDCVCEWCVWGGVGTGGAGPVTCEQDWAARLAPGPCVHLHLHLHLLLLLLLLLQLLLSCIFSPL